MSRAKDLLVRLLGRVGLATPAYRVYEAVVARRATRGLDTAAPGPDGLPFPPPAVILSVAGTTDTARFLEGGQRAVTALRDVLQRHGTSLDAQQSVLEFGCGCGRVVRHLASLPGKVHGCDWNPAAVDWCSENLTFATFARNQLLPPLPYADASFDFVYALSVFTHMGEEIQRPWMDELRRVLRPGGHLVVTTLGRRHAKELSPDEQARFERGEFVSRHVEGAGTNLCSAFHPERYVREVFTRGWTLLEFVPEGALGNPWQDLTLLRRD